MRRTALLIPFGLLLAGCADLPRDPDGTTDRVRAQRLFRVGIVAKGSDARGTAEEGALLAAVARDAGARPLVTRGAMEPLLARLETGDLDLVVGHFDARSPWSRRVTLTDPIVDYGTHRVAAALPNGENRWIMLVERAARQVGR